MDVTASENKKRTFCGKSPAHGAKKIRWGMFANLCTYKNAYFPCRLNAYAYYHPFERRPPTMEVKMHTKVSANFHFEDLPVRIAGKPHRLFGDATILFNHITWLVGTIRVFDDVPSHAVRKMSADSEMHDTVKRALLRHCREAIDELVVDQMEHCGGYERLFGYRLPAAEAWRGMPRRSIAKSLGLSA